MLALLLLARQTTVLQFYKHEFIIFEETGGYSSRDLDEELLFLPINTWFLVDSSDYFVVPPEAFLNACTMYPRKIIVATSPRSPHFTFKKKYKLVSVMWMQPFDLSELIAA